MKRIPACICAGVMLLTLAACGRAVPQAGDAPRQSPAQTEQAPDKTESTSNPTPASIPACEGVSASGSSGNAGDTAAHSNTVSGYVYEYSEVYNVITLTNGSGDMGEYYSFDADTKRFDGIKSGDQVEIAYESREGAYGAEMVATEIKLLASARAEKKSGKVDDISTGIMTLQGDDNDYYILESTDFRGYRDNDVYGRKATFTFVELEGVRIVVQLTVD